MFFYPLGNYTYMANIMLIVVDDEEDIQWLFEKQFRKEIKSDMVELHCFRAGKLALDYVQHRSLGDNGIMLIDINMPGMNGLELLKLVKDQFSDLPVFMITAYNNAQNLRTAYQYGADDFISKPIDFVSLKQKILRYFMSH